jgi:hypothetical protein
MTKETSMIGNKMILFEKNRTKSYSLQLYNLTCACACGSNLLPLIVATNYIARNVINLFILYYIIPKCNWAKYCHNSKAYKKIFKDIGNFVCENENFRNQQ